MKNRSLVKRQLKQNPQFAQWVKGQPEMLEQIKDDPDALKSMIVSWKRDEQKKANLEKVQIGYRQMASQIQELSSLLQKVDHIISNVKSMSVKMKANKPKEKVQKVKAAPVKRTRSRSK